MKGERRHDMTTREIIDEIEEIHRNEVACVVRGMYEQISIYLTRVGAVNREIRVGQGLMPEERDERGQHD